MLVLLKTTVLIILIDIYKEKLASHRFVVDKWSSILVACCSSSASTNSTVSCHTVVHRVVFIVSLFVSVPFYIYFCSVRN